MPSLARHHGPPPIDTAPPWKPVRVALTTDGPADQLIRNLRADYPDLVFISSGECSPDQIVVSVNRVTLYYLLCRSDITSVTYQ